MAYSRSKYANTAEFMKKKRLETGLSAQMLSGVSGVHVATISNIERGICGLGSETFEKLKDYLDLDITKFTRLHANSLAIVYDLDNKSEEEIVELKLRQNLANILYRVMSRRRNQEHGAWLEARYFDDVVFPNGLKIIYNVVVDTYVRHSYYQTKDNNVYVRVDDILSSYDKLNGSSFFKEHEENAVKKMLENMFIKNYYFKFDKRPYGADYEFITANDAEKFVRHIEYHYIPKIESFKKQGLSNLGVDAYDDSEIVFIGKSKIAIRPIRARGSTPETYMEGYSAYIDSSYRKYVEISSFHDLFSISGISNDFEAGELFKTLKYDFHYIKNKEYPDSIFLSAEGFYIAHKFKSSDIGWILRQDDKYADEYFKAKVVKPMGTAMKKLTEINPDEYLWRIHKKLDMAYDCMVSLLNVKDKTDPIKKLIHDAVFEQTQ
jgi:transcriptional regulator with XRE-family HTH domain